VVRFVMPGQAGTDARRVPSDVFNTLFGGSFTSRLNQNLREEHGYSYGASSSFARQPDQGVFIASSAVRTDVTGAALQEFMGEFARARAGGIDEPEAAGARAGVLSRIVSSYESLGSTVFTWLAVRDRGGAPADVVQDIAALGRVGPAQLDALAPQLLPTDQLLLVLVGDAEEVLPQLAELELPSVSLVDEHGQPVGR
jgi:zinc protease